MHKSLRSLVILLAIITSTALAGAANGVELLVGFSRNSATHLMASLIADGLARQLGEPVQVHSLVGDHGFRSALAAHDATPDGSVLLLGDSLTMSLNEAAGGRPFSINDLTPIAKLTDGISVALVVREDSRLDDWAAFVSAASKAPLRLSVSDRRTAYGIAWSMLERGTGIAFDQVAAQGNGIILADVATGRAEAGIVTTNTIDGFNAVSEDKLRPLVTFGAARSPRYPGTPTFAELTNNEKNDFTYSFAIFAPPGMNADHVARLGKALSATLAETAVQERALSHGIPLAFNGAEILQQTVDRDLHVARGVAEFLHR